MKLISWNTNGLRATVKQGNFTALFDQEKADIICLQETKSEIDQLDEQTKNVPGYTSYFVSSQTRRGYSGVCIYTKEKPLQVEYTLGAKEKELDLEGRTLILYFKKFTLINCYFPNGGRGPERLAFKLRFYDAFLKKCEDLRKDSREIIFCGDVNTAHTEIDLARPKENANTTGFLAIERAWIDLITSKGYVDTFRLKHPDTKDMYTYWDQITRARDRNVGWRIDYFFITPKLIPKVVDSYMLTDYMGSDHCPIVLELK